VIRAECPPAEGEDFLPSTTAAAECHSRAVRAALIYGAGDVLVEDVPDPKLVEPTDAVVRVLRACICGSDLWPYGSRPATEEGTGSGTSSSA
jgi:hypothetical protein